MSDQRATVKNIFSTQQENRYQKIFTEPLYQIDFKQEEDKNTFFISGSTKNVYEVVLKNRKFECTCPDAKTWSKKHHVVCKHICFVLFRVSKIFIKLEDKIYFGYDLDQPTTFFETHKLNDKEQEFMENFLIKRQFGKDVMNDILKEKYLQRVNVPTTPLFQKSTKVLEITDECPICYDVLLNEEFKVEMLLSCPDCKNFVHPKCMEKWLEYNKTCVYCRSDIWIRLNEKKKEYINLN
jgi:hypothetical protein